MGKEVSIDQGKVLGHLAQFVGDLAVEGKADTGSISETLILRRDNGERLILQRDVLNRGVEILSEERRFLEYLRANGFPVVGAISFGSYPFFECDDQVYSVYPFIDGERLDINKQTHRELAYDAIGEYLSLSNSYHHEIETWQNRWWNVSRYPFEENFRNYIELSSDAEAVREIYQSCRDNLFNRIITPARRGLYKTGIIHSDFRPEHFLFEGDVLKGVIDWTSSHHDVLIMELARPFLYLCQSAIQRRMLLEKVVRYMHFSQEETEATFFTPLILELTEFVWILRHKNNFGVEEFRSELETATKHVRTSYEICREIS